MALNKTVLKNSIVQIMTDMLTREETSIEEYATRLSDAIEDYVKGAKITYQNGLAAPNGAVTGIFNGKLE
jgi:hypothetical protein